MHGSDLFGMPDDGLGFVDPLTRRTAAVPYDDQDLVDEHHLHRLGVGF